MDLIKTGQLASAKTVRDILLIDKNTPDGIEVSTKMGLVDPSREARVAQALGAGDESAIKKALIKNNGLSTANDISSRLDKPENAGLKAFMKKMEPEFAKPNSPYDRFLGELGNNLKGDPSLIDTLG